jgi:flagellar biosynthesis protein FliQ
MEAFSLLELSRKALWLVVVLSSPVVLVAMGVGLLVGIFQAATQIQEFTLSFVPKILAVLLVVGWLAPWMGQHLIGFARLALSWGW